MREFYDKIGGWFTVASAAGVAFIIVFAIVWLAWGPPTRQERMEDLERRVTQLEAERQ